MTQKEIRKEILRGLMALRDDRLYHHISEILVPKGISLSEDDAFAISKYLIDLGLVDGIAMFGGFRLKIMPEGIEWLEEQEGATDDQGSTSSAPPLAPITVSNSSNVNIIAGASHSVIGSPVSPHLDVKVIFGLFEHEDELIRGHSHIPNYGVEIINLSSTRYPNN